MHVATWDEEIPTRADIDALLAFVADSSGSGPLLMHCRSGVGRSPAAAFVALCALNPGVDELFIAGALRQVAPFVRPNEVLVRLGDAALAREGRMLRALEETRVHSNSGAEESAPGMPTRGRPFSLPSRFG